MRTVILAGGTGTRMNGACSDRPKPLVEIGGKPILYHIMSSYRAQGFDNFVVAGGYKWEMIRDYCAGLTGFNIRVIDTGLASMTGGRLLRLKELLKGEPDFMMTYGDGMSDIDLHKLISFHHAEGRNATVTAVNPPFPFGKLDLEDNRVTSFLEKKPDPDTWINGGFFVLKPAVLDYIKDDDTIWEKEPLEELSKAGQLTGYRHQGFWKCLDTIKDKQELQAIWETGKAPWKGWED